MSFRSPQFYPSPPLVQNLYGAPPGFVSPAPGIALDEEEEPAPNIDYNDSIEVHDHFTIRFQKWSQKKNRYLPFDPRIIKAPQVEKNVENYFYVNTRYFYLGGPPSLFLSDWSDPLLHFLRANVGGMFFGPSPERSLEEFYPELDLMKDKLRQVKSVLQDRSKHTSDEKKKLSESLGRFQVVPSTEDELVQQFTNLAKHLEVFVNYVSEKFQPLQDRLDLCINYGQMEFDLLKYYFKKDELIVTTTDDPVYDPPVAIKVKSTNITNKAPGPGHLDNPQQIFLVEGEGYEWNGSAYTPRRVKLECEHFEGSKNISSLPFVHLAEEMKESLTARGRLYTTYSGVHFLSYNGARVIVDRTGWNHHLASTILNAPIASADKRRRTRGARRVQEYDDEYYPDGEDNSVKDSTPRRVRPQDQKIPQIEEERLPFLPAIVHGFNLEGKRWIPMLIEKLGPVTFDEGAWDHLVLDPKVKTLIKGLVEVTRQQNVSPEAMINDVIRGKGGGLVCVLHGPPGTGKTLTAEAVAELLRRPLYIAGATELTTDPSELEKTLGGILDLATAWDAVVLVDEADVFLEQRSLHELERNSLVSAVLRLLEYHQGVLFLTTNRITAFDPAFMSRISIAIKYPELNHSGRFTIWSKFFELAGYKIKDTSDGPNTFTHADVEELASKPFNGRTIKNLVRTAQALALASNSPLTLEHLNVVVDSQEKFIDEFAGMKI
ncbi:hypothetical protein VKT23_011762 [Stygiomarasmius scandens]|uniref:AAA+ ATPase domain-containing protein n=1 Tax=Marasmiellus scandens TaxID=2682957 RepID=A0ABR1JAL8_9AGAR